ncbi:MAG: hypothetical protein WEB93_02515, partial [Sphingomonadales bacterium]
MNAVGRAAGALHGAWRLANFDRRGFDRFDISADGFWHSFLAALVGLPLFIVHAFLEKQAAQQMLTEAGQDPVFGPFYLSALVVYALIWPLFAAVMIPVLRLAGKSEALAALVIAWNWARVMAMAIRLP